MMMLKSSLKLLCLNLFEGGLLSNKLQQFLEQEKPDIACFQEVFNGQTENLPPNYRSLQTLQTVLPNYKIAYAPELLCRTPYGKIENGNAIFSRFPIIKSGAIFYGILYGEFDEKPSNNDWSQRPKNIQSCKINIGARNLQVLNTHGIWGLTGTDNPQRLHMADVILNVVNETDPLILAGDFNVNPHTETIGKIEKKLRNVFKNDLSTTFNLHHKNLAQFPGYATAVVDMIFVSQSVKVLHKHCPQVDISDHLPLIVNFEI